MRPRRAALVVVASLTALAPVGCGSSSGDAQVRATLRRFVTAIRARDPQTICRRVFAPQLVAGIESRGRPCEVFLTKSNLFQARDVRLRVRQVTIDGDRARARVRTSAAKQAPSVDTLRLVRVSGAWRIAVPPGPAATRPSPGKPGAKPAPKGTGD